MIGRAGVWLLCVLAAALSLAWMLVLVVPGGDRFWRFGRGFDQTAGVSFGGSEDTTISTRAGLAARRGARWGCVLCKVLDRIDPGHCDRAADGGI